jgi:hypothetical protein
LAQHRANSQAENAAFSKSAKEEARMSDIFREVDEDVRTDKLTEFWSKYSIVVLGLALAIVAGTAIFVYLRHQKQVEAEAAGDRYLAAQTLATQNQPEAATKAFDELAKSAPKGYQMLARLRAAEELSFTDRAGAVKQLDALAADAGPGQLWQDLARLRAALLRVDEADKAELELRLAPLLNGSFRHTAREYLGLAALKRGDVEDAGKWFDQLIVDPNAPADLRQRVQAMLSLVRGGGKVSPPAPAEPAQK